MKLDEGVLGKKRRFEKRHGIWSWAWFGLDSLSVGGRSMLDQVSIDYRWSYDVLAMLWRLFAVSLLWSYDLLVMFSCLFLVSLILH